MATVTVLRNPAMTATLDEYDAGSFYCELLGNPQNPNPALTKLWHRLQQMELADLSARSKDAERELFMLGITFTVYSDRNAIDRILPFDVIPRVITSQATGAASKPASSSASRRSICFSGTSIMTATSSRMARSRPIWSSRT